MDIDQLAALLQREYETLRGEMATRDELHGVESNVLRAIEGVSTQVRQIASQWTRDFERLTDRVHDLGGHVTKLEAEYAPP